MLYPFYTPLQARTIIRGRNTYPPPARARKAGLSLNCLFNGWGMYETDAARFSVDDNVFLVLNAGREYAFSIASATMVESLSICFPDEWLADAYAASNRSCADLLDTPFANMPPAEFFETLYYHDQHLSAPIQHLRQRLDSGPVSEPELEEMLRVLADALLRAQHRFERRAETIAAVRQSTRHELLRRLYRAKAYIHANVEYELPLSEIARAAALAPHHFLRTFRANFGVTPHAYLVQQRLARARLLLAGTDLSVHSICTRIGFPSAPSFSNLFRRHHGLSPRAYRQRHAK
jgi:AraC family transcriptional regulator